MLQYFLDSGVKNLVVANCLTQPLSLVDTKQCMAQAASTHVPIVSMFVPIVRISVPIANIRLHCYSEAAYNSCVLVYSRIILVFHYIT